jgi:hypothetical protein
LKLIQFRHKIIRSTSRTIIHEQNEINDIHKMQHSFNHTFKLTQSKIWDNYVCSIHLWDKLHTLQFFPASFFYSTMLYSILSHNTFTMQQQLSEDWLHELLLSCMQPILSSHRGYLLCPITITNSYYQIRVNTLYLQPLTVLYDFTNMTYLKMMFPKYLNNSI